MLTSPRSNWKSIESRSRSLPVVWAPPVLVPDSDTVISKGVLRTGACSADAPAGSSVVPLRVPKVAQPKVIREQYTVRLDV